MIKRRKKNPIKRILRKTENKIINDKPKTIYHYDYEHDTGEKVSPEERSYVEKLFIPHRIDNDSLRIHPKGSRILAEYQDTKGRKIHRYSQKEILENVLEKYRRDLSYITFSPEFWENCISKVPPKKAGKTLQDVSFHNHLVARCDIENWWCGTALNNLHEMGVWGRV